MVVDLCGASGKCWYGPPGANPLRLARSAWFFRFSRANRVSAATKAQPRETPTPAPTAVTEGPLSLVLATGCTEGEVEESEELEEVEDVDSAGEGVAVGVAFTTPSDVFCAALRLNWAKTVKLL